MSGRHPSIVRVTRVPLYVGTERPWVVHTLAGWDDDVMHRPAAKTFKTVDKARKHANHLTRKTNPR